MWIEIQEAVPASVLAALDSLTSEFSKYFVMHDSGKMPIREHNRLYQEQEAQYKSLEGCNSILHRRIEKLKDKNEELTNDIAIYLTARLDAMRELNLHKLTRDLGTPRGQWAEACAKVQELEETILVMRIMNASQEETIKGFQKGRDNLIQMIEGA